MKTTSRFKLYQQRLFPDTKPRKIGLLRVSPHFIKDPVFGTAMKMLELETIDTRKEFATHTHLLLVTGKKLAPVLETEPLPMYKIQIENFNGVTMVTDINEMRYPIASGQKRRFSLMVEKAGKDEVITYVTQLVSI